MYSESSSNDYSQTESDESSTDESSELDCYNKLLKTVHKYGGSEDEVIEPCLRVRKIKQYSIGGHKCRSYTVGFIKHHGYHPNEIIDEETEVPLEISHKCANPRNKKQSLCIEGTHMKLETHEANQTRTICHNYIRKYWEKHKNNDSCITTGPLTVEIVNEQLSNLYPFDVFVFECDCDDDCFINFGKIY